MSTDRQRLQAAIQRIAKQDPDLSALIGASKNKGGQASSSGIGVSDAERDNLCCDGTTGAGANAGADTRDPNEDGSDTLDATDPANLDAMGQGSLTGVTDCATGDPICFHGDEFIPPDGWDGPYDPPPDPTWEEGNFWIVNWITPTGSGTDYHAGRPNVCGYRGACINFECDETTSGFGTECPDGDYEIFASQRSCDDHPNDPEAQAVCVDEAPLLDAWPRDDCINLSIAGGKVVGSKFDVENVGNNDPDKTADYSAPRNEIELCDGSGNSFLLSGAANGGWKSIKSLSGDIDPDTGNGYLYRPNGQRVRQISPSEFRDDTV